MLGILPDQSSLIAFVLASLVLAIFSAFLPQFIDPHSSTIVQSIVLGVAFVLIASITDTTYALTASTIAPAIARARARRNVGRYITASAFIGLGLFTAASGSRHSK